jgi:hypothetical protein
MAASTKAVKIGVIVEEINDLEVLYELTKKIIKENQFSFLHFVGHGCGKLQKKCRAWGRNLLDRGCNHIVLVHDLDRRNEKELRETLEKEMRDLEATQKVIVIPIEEMEAWLLADAKVIKEVFRLSRAPRLPSNPEKISNPKEYLARLVREGKKSQYLNTVHNKRIAGKIPIASVRRCSSFSTFEGFLRAVFPKASSRVA